MNKSLFNKISSLSLGILMSINLLKAQENYQPKYNTVKHQSMKILESVEKPYPSYKTLDSIIDVSKEKIMQKENYSDEEKKIIAKEIYDITLEALPNIKEKEQPCYEMTGIGLAIAKENNLPLYAILIPQTIDGHVTLMWDDKKDGHDILNSKNPINKGDLIFEATTGEFVKDSSCISILTSKNAIKNGSYLNPINENQFLSLAYRYKAEKEIMQEKYIQALKDCNKAIELDPKSVHAYQVRGLIYSKAGVLTKAIQDFNKAIEINPEPAIYTLRGNAYDKSKEYEKAKEDYTLSINIVRGFKQIEEDSVKLSNLNELEIINLIGRHNVYRKMGYLKEAMDDMADYTKIRKIQEQNSKNK